MMLIITAPHFVAGIEVDPESKKRVAPILRWMVRKGWSEQKIIDYCHRQGWKVEKLGNYIDDSLGD